MRLAEDVYYVSRDQSVAVGLNSLITLDPVQSLGEVELRAIEIMCRRAGQSLDHRISWIPIGPVRAQPGPDNYLGLPHGLYYIGPDGAIWPLHEERQRPDLDAQAYDFAKAVVQAGLARLQRLRSDASTV